MKKPTSAHSSFPPGQPDALLNLVPQDQAPSVEVSKPAPQPARAIVKQVSIQDALLAEGVLGVKLSVGCKSMDELNELLIKNLSQNSLETRHRYVQSITRWFFPEGIDGLLPKVR